MGRIPFQAAEAAQLSHGLADGLEGDLQSFKAGAVLVDDGGGFLDEGGANPTSIVGVATRDGQNNAADGVDSAGNPARLAYIPASPEYVFMGSFDRAAALGTTGIAQTDLYVQYGITKDANGIWYIDKDKASGAGTGRVQVVEILDPIGTNSARVKFRFLPLATIYGLALA